MRYEGAGLVSILRNQTQPVQLCDAAGAPIKTMTVVEIEPMLDDLISRGFVGIGNKYRIRRIQAMNPSIWGAGWRGGSHTTQRIRDDRGVVIAPLYSVEHKPLPTY